MAASIFVGESRPSRTPSSTYYDSGAGSGYSSIQKGELGITLEVTPYAKRGGFIELDIHSEIDQFVGYETLENVGDVPITTSTKAQSKMMVRDRETLLLGGLIETNRPRNTAGIPVLKDIPVLSALFRRHSPDPLQ